MESETGADIGDGVRLFLPKQFSLVISHTPEHIEMAFAPPADLYVKRLLGLVNIHGTLQRITISQDQLVAEIDGLPDQQFRIVS